MRFARWILWALVPAGLVLAVFLVGLALLGWRSLDDQGAVGVGNYAAFAARPDYLNALGRTLGLSLSATAASILVGYPVARAIMRAGRWRGALMILVVLPWMVSVVVRTYGWMVLLGNRGTVNSFLRWMGAIEAPLPMMFNATGIFIGLVHVLCPFMILSLLAVMAHLDRSLEEAAMSLGAGPTETFLRVTLPLTLPGLVTGSMVVFLLATGSVVTPLLLGGPRTPMLATQIFRDVFELFNFPRAATMAVILMVFALLAIAPLSWIDRRSRRVQESVT